MVRLKNRYLLVPDLVSFNQPTTDNLTPNLLIKAIRAEVLELFGDYGSGAIAESLSIKYFSPATSTFIIRVSRAHFRIVWAALSFMDAVPIKNGKSCVFQVVRVSGTIRKAEEEAIRNARDIILRAKRELREQSADKLDNMLGKPKILSSSNGDGDLFIPDRSDIEKERFSDGDG